MSGDQQISQLFAALLSDPGDLGVVRFSEDVADTETPAEPATVDTAAMSHAQAFAFLASYMPDEDHVSLESLPAPNMQTFSQAAQIEANQVLETVLSRMATAEDITDRTIRDDAIKALPDAALLEALSSDERRGAGGGFLIYNAAFLPGWPLPRFDAQSTQSLDALRQYVDTPDEQTEADVVNYLSQFGLNRAMLEKILKTFQTKAERAGFLVWISAVFATIVRTLKILAEEATDALASVDVDLGTGFRRAARQVSPRNRRFLRI